MQEKLKTWFEHAPVWVRYRANIDLFGDSEHDAEMMSLKNQVIADPQIQSSLNILQAWQTTPLKRHNDSSHPLHHLVFLSDLGFTFEDDKRITDLVEFILSNLDETNIPRMLFNVPEGYGGSGEDQFAWMLCDAPLVLYTLSKLGLREEPKLLKARQQLMSYAQENGWPCKVSEDLGKFRGPGRKSDPCPYASLLMIKLLSINPQPIEIDALNSGVESLLSFWAERHTKKMYLFGIGTDFQKLKAPLIWFDLLHVLDVFSMLPFTYQDPRLIEMLDVLKGKANQEGLFTAEFAYLPWKNWEFGQKKIPSTWISLLSLRIQERMNSPQ